MEKYCEMISLVHSVVGHNNVYNFLISRQSVLYGLKPIDLLKVDDSIEAITSAINSIYNL